MDYQELTRKAVRGLKHLGSFHSEPGDDGHPLDCSLAGRVSRVFCLGMTRSVELCRDAGEDPDHRERHCENCDILVAHANDLDEVGFCNHCQINADN